MFAELFIKKYLQINAIFIFRINQMKSSSISNKINIPAFKCPVLVLGVTALALTVIFSLRILDKPNPLTYANFDEWAYAMPGLAWAETGKFSTDYFFPPGFFEDGNYFVYHPQLSAYLEALSIKWFGFSRVGIRIPSLLLYGLASILLFYLWKKVSNSKFQGIVIAGLFFGSPWIQSAATTARPEMLSCFLVFLSCALIVMVRFHPTLSMLLGGSIAGVALYNHPVFAGAACLPFLIGLRMQEIQLSDFSKVFRSALTYAGGVLLGIVFLVCLILVPHWNEWQEQFLGAVSTPYFHSKESISVLGSLASLKARFSTFGFSYSLWYFLVIFSFLIFFRFNVLFIIGIIWICVWMLVVHLQTQPVMVYCTQFSVGVVIVALLAGSSRFVFAERKLTKALLGVFTFAVIVIHSFNVTSPTDGSLELAKAEAKALKYLADVKKPSVITGDTLLPMAVALAGHRYYYTGKTPYGIVGDERYQKLLAEIVKFKVQSDGTIRPINQ